MAANRSTHRTMALLELLASRKVLSLAEISKELEVPKSSVFDILQPLLEKGYVEVANADLKTYQLGFSTFSLGNAYRSNLNIYEICRPALLALNGALDKTIFLGLLRNGRVLNLDKQDPSRYIFSEGAIGVEQPIYCTSMGKAMLSVMREDEVLEMLGPGPYEKKTETTLTSYDALLEDLAKTRERGYAIDDGENYDHIYCMAMPIINQMGRPVAAISVSSVRSNFPEEDREKVVDCLRENVNLINRRLGYTGERLY